MPTGSRSLSEGKAVPTAPPGLVWFCFGGLALLVDGMGPWRADVVCGRRSEGMAWLRTSSSVSRRTVRS
jgi:hypothetical protein